MEIKNIRKTEINLSSEDKKTLIKISKMILEIKGALINLQGNKDFILLTDDGYFDLSELEVTENLLYSLGYSDKAEILDREDA